MSEGGVTGDSARLAPYLPRIAVEWAGRPEQRWRTVDASLAFVDVSGFTALSERLAEQGRAGAEELTDLLGTCFSELLADAYAQGGSLLKFGGDALLLIFDGPDHALRAARGAAAMRRTTRQVGRLKTSVGNVRLRTSAGIHSGEVHLFRVGKSHQELIVTGATPSRVLEMEAAASAGEIIISADTAVSIDPALVGDERPPGFALRDRAIRQPDRGSPEAPPATADLASAIPVTLRPHLLAGDLEPEHRHVAIAFVGFRLDAPLLAAAGAAGAAGAAEALEELMTEVQDAVDDHGVTFLGTDIDRDGGKILLVAGAPEARDDDSGRMLGALRRIADAQGALPIRVGVNRGCVFAGDIGPEYRRTYTVMGDAVNLAARLMGAAADGEILATEELITHSRRAYDTTPREPFEVKGKAELVRAFAVAGPTQSNFRRGGAAAPLAPLVGRDREMDNLLWLLAKVNTSGGATVQITGPAGIGKSRLVDEFKRRNPALEVVITNSEPYEQTTPWSTFGRFLRSAGLTVDPVRDFAHLEPRLARQRTHEAVMDRLVERFPTAVVFVFEDLQWADDASVAALEFLSTEAKDKVPWLILITRRDDALQSFPQSPDDFHLEPLDEAAAKQFIAAATTRAPLRPHRRDSLVRGGGGNPLFLEELLRAGAAGTDEALPDSIEGAVVSGLDRLPTNDRRLLRYAAVLGIEFDVETFAYLAGEPISSVEVLARRWAGLAEPAAADRMRFSSQVVRDVAYETLSFRKRRDLHGLAGNAIEASASGDDVPAELLSLHFLHARRYEKCWRYAVMAARRAGSLYASASAAQLYERALSVARHIRDLDPAAVGEAWEQAANALHNLGEYERAEAAYRQARRLFADDAEALARLHIREARIAELQGRPTTALRRLKRGIRTLEEGGASASPVLADLQVMHGWVSHRLGRQRDAKTWAARALTSAEASGNARGLAEANLLFDWAALHLGATGPWDHAAAALPIFEKLGDLNRIAFTLNAMGAFAYYAGQWDEAAKLYGRALDVYTRAGNDGDAAQARYNVAEMLLDQGRLDEARSMLKEVEPVYRAVGYRAGLGLTSRDLGRIAAQHAEFEEAHQLLQEARGIFAELQAVGRVVEVDVWIADLLFRQGRREDCLRLLAAAEDRAKRGGFATSLRLLDQLRSRVDAPRVGADSLT